MALSNSHSGVGLTATIDVLRGLVVAVGSKLAVDVAVRKRGVIVNCIPRDCPVVRVPNPITRAKMSNMTAEAIPMYAANFRLFLDLANCLRNKASSSATDHFLGTNAEVPGFDVGTLTPDRIRPSRAA